MGQNPEGTRLGFQLQIPHTKFYRSKFESIFITKLKSNTKNPEPLSVFNSNQPKFQNMHMQDHISSQQIQGTRESPWRTLTRTTATTISNVQNQILNPQGLTWPRMAHKNPGFTQQERSNQGQPNRLIQPSHNTYTRTSCIHTYTTSNSRPTTGKNSDNCEQKPRSN